MVFEKEMLRTVLGPKVRERSKNVIETLCNMECHNYAHHKILIGVIKSRRMRRVYI